MADGEQPQSPATAVRGLVAEPPADGRFVKVDGGYMVPYTETIPGTDATFTMVPVPGGEFLLGSPADEPARSEDEGPQVRVKVEPFWIGQHEVTWAEYRAFMAMYDAFKKMQLLSSRREGKDAAGEAGEGDEDWRLVLQHAWNGKLEKEWRVDAVTSPTPLYESSFTYSVGDQPNQPAVTITQYAAKQYTKWLSGITGRDYRLPTEAEWEYAARAGTTTPYSFGDDADDLHKYGWYEDNADYQTHPVGSKEPNPWGIYDMHGNVAEWVLDEYQPDAYAKLAAVAGVSDPGYKSDPGDNLDPGQDGAIDAKQAWRRPTTDQPFPRVIRGGSWLEPASMARSAARHKSADDDEWKLSDPNIPLSPWWFTEEAAQAVGMRIIRPLEPLSAEEKRQVWEADVEFLRQDVGDRLREGRGALGVADETLPDAVKAAEQLDKDR